MKKYLTIVVILLFGFSHSQTKRTIEKILDEMALQTGYAKIGKNLAYLGFDKRIDKKNDWIYINIGAGTYFSNIDSTLEFVPEIHTNFTALILKGEISLTNKAANPGLGLNILNVVKLKIGYNFAFDRSSYQGTTVSFNINIGRKDYRHLPSMKFW